MVQTIKGTNMKNSFFLLVLSWAIAISTPSMAQYAYDAVDLGDFENRQTIKDSISASSNEKKYQVVLRRFGCFRIRNESPDTTVRVWFRDTNGDEVHRLLAYPGQVGARSRTFTLPEGRLVLVIKYLRRKRGVYDLRLFRVNC